MESGVPYCSTCGESVGFVSGGEGKEEVFVACHGCGYPLCKACLEDEIRDGRTSCLRCEEPYRHALGMLMQIAEFVVLKTGTV